MQKLYIIKSPDDFLNTVSKKIKQTNIVLDIWSWIQPQNYIKPIVHICAEPYEEYAQYLLEKIDKRDRFFIVLKQKWDEIVNTIPHNWVDSIISLDVIEHIEKEEWKILIKKSIPLVREQIVIFTPYWFLPQEVPEWMKDAWWLDWAEWQRHKSWWTEKDFDENWDIYVCPEFHFFDAITWKKHEKPYWALFAIYNKKEAAYYKKRNIYSLIRFLYWWMVYSIPLAFKSNKILYNWPVKFIYRKIILPIIRTIHGK